MIHNLALMVRAASKPCRHFSGSAGSATITIAERMNDQRPISLSELSALSEYAAVIIAEEVGDWGFVYRGRPLT